MGGRYGDEYIFTEGTDFAFGKDKAGPDASDATLIVSDTVTLNASVSSYTASRPSVVRSKPSARVLKLPKALSFLLSHGVKSTILASTINNMVLAVADTGATDHMCPDRSAFISYHHCPQIN